MADSCCGSGLDAAQLAAQHRRVLIWVLTINLITFAMMVAGSVLSGSSALLSGTLDNLGDALTYALSIAVIAASAHAKARVALFKGALISAAAIGVAIQIAWRVTHFEAPVAETMGIAAILNLMANMMCLRLLYPIRNDDINMNSVWECSRNDVFEGVAVIITAGLVWLTQSAWPDLLVATALLVLFIRSASRVVKSAWRELHALPAPTHSGT